MKKLGQQQLLSELDEVLREGTLNRCKVGGGCVYKYILRKCYVEKVLNPWDFLYTFSHTFANIYLSRPRKIKNGGK